MSGPGARLFDALGGDAYLFTLTPADVGLPDAYAEPSALYCHERMSTLRAAVAAAFDGPLMFAAEVGDGSGSSRGRLHVHIVAHRADGPRHIRRGSERCKAVYNPQGVLEYLGKPPERWSLEAEADFRAARLASSRARAPQTRGKLLGRERMAWAEANALARVLPSPPQPAPSNRPSEPAQRLRSLYMASPVAEALAPLVAFGVPHPAGRRAVVLGRLGPSPPCPLARPETFDQPPDWSTNREHYTTA